MSTDPAPEAGLVTVPSAHGAAETVERLEAALRQKGVHLFARIDHAEGARQAGLSLRPTVVLLFGNPQVGTALMQANQTAGLDLPLKALVWEDGTGKVWLTYNDPAYLARRHGLVGQEATARAMATGLQALARAATEL